MSVCGVSKAHFVIGNLVSGLILLCSVVIYRPLYVGYFVFFLAYVVKFVSLLYPLFATSLLLLIAFVTGVVGKKCGVGRLSEGGVGYLLVAYGSEGNCDRNEDFGMFEVLFGSSEVEENRVEEVDENQAEATLSLASEDSEQGDLGIGETEGCKGIEDEIDSISCPQLENGVAGSDEKRLENFLKILDQFERMTSNSNVEEKKNVEPYMAGSLVRNGSEEIADKVNVVSAAAQVDNPREEKQDKSMVKYEDSEESLPRFDSFDHSSLSTSYELGSYGSMRKEKEWKRTLACKLFEERHNVGGGEGMDSLWEAYEMDPNKPVKSKMDKKKREIDEGGEEDQVQQLCCLQALKLSTRKMNLGMRKPNLVKITKAIKGLGWLHHVSSKHSKKVHNNGDNRY